jgi:hypothetical protein
VTLAEHQLAEVLKVLTEASVPALVIKGAAVGAFYPDPALRPYSDLDVLVPEMQLERAEEALQTLGYWCSQPKAWWLQHDHHLPPIVSDRGWLRVEVHWRLDRGEAPGRLPAEDLWSRAIPWSVENEPALRLDQVDTALYLCRHAVVKHRARMGLRPLCDLVQVTEGWGQDDWDALVQRTKEYGMARPVYLMLVLVECALGQDVPAEVMSVLGPADNRPMPDDLVEALLSLEDWTGASVPVAAVQAGAKSTFVTRLRHLSWHLFLPRDGMAVVYNIPADSPRIWLTYLWRPVDLLRRYGRSAWGMLRGERAARAAWAREVWLEHWLRASE